ncbi:unnamed protein product, partial [Amoebophrya sp. A25]|eukprot:GSA25T00003018001.1
MLTRSRLLVCRLLTYPATSAAGHYAPTPSESPQRTSSRYPCYLSPSAFKIQRKRNDLPEVFVKKLARSPSATTFRTQQSTTGARGSPWRWLTSILLT